MGISTHTLTWSVTVAGTEYYLNGIDFNSHAHVERDHVILAISLQTLISTHTLTWSVTNNFLSDYIPMIISTHTLTWSVTILQILTLKTLRFQLTRSRGA